MEENNKSVKYILFYLFIAFSILPITIVLWNSYQDVIDTEMKIAFNHLKSVSMGKRKALEKNFSNISSQINYFSDNKKAQQYYLNIKQQFENLADNNYNFVSNEASYLRSFYANNVIEDFPDYEDYKVDDIFPDDSLSIFLQSHLFNNKDTDEHPYFAVRNKMQRYFENFSSHFGIENIYLIDNKTDYIIYSKNKQIDYGLNMNDGYLKYSAMSIAYARSKETPQKARFSDFSLYLPNAFLPTYFCAKQIINDDGDSMGTIVFQCNQNDIDGLLLDDKHWEESGLGQSGESFIVGSDSLMRSNSRFLIETPDKYYSDLKNIQTDTSYIKKIRAFGSAVLFQPAKSLSVELGLKNKEGQHVIVDYRGIKVLSVYSPIYNDDLNWVIMSEIDYDEEVVSFIALILKDNYLYIFLTVFILVSTYYFSQYVSKPIIQASKNIEQFITSSDEVLEVERNYSEIKTLVTSVNRLKKELINIKQHNKEDREKLLKQKAEISDNFNLVKKAQEEMIANYNELNLANQNLKRSQNQLIESGKMASVGKMLAGISHEINTPLGAIRASIENQLALMDEIINAFEITRRIVSDEDMPSFVLLLSETIRQSQIIRTTREERQQKRELNRINEESAYGISKSQCNKLGEMGIQDLKVYLTLLKSENADELLQIISVYYKLFASMSTITSASGKCDTVIKALKEFAYTKVDIVEFELQRSIETIITLYQNLTKHMDIQVNLQHLPKVMGIENELSQVWTNIIQNAIHATESTKNERKPTILISGREMENTVLIDFKDNGPGVPEEIKDKIFNAFYTTKEKGKGTGLGLDIVKDLVIKHGGDISFTSSSEGTIFTVEIPKKESLQNQIIENRMPIKYEV